MLTEKEIINIANNYAKLNKSEYFSLQYCSAQTSRFLDGYWDVSFKVFNEKGNEIEGPLLMVINEQTGNISTMEEIIMPQKGSKDIKVTNRPIKKS